MSPKTIVISSITAAIFIFGGISSCHNVPAGNVGVPRLFGKVYDKPLPEGMNFLNPLANVVDYDCREDVFVIDDISFPSQDQLTSTADITVKWRINSAQANELYQNTGDRAAVVDRHLEPKVRSLIREVSRSVKTAEEFFNNEVQSKIQSDLTDQVKIAMAPKGVIVEEVMVRDVKLPKVVQDGVLAKKVREQKAQEQEAELARYKTEQQQTVEKASAEKQSAEMLSEKVKIEADAQAYKLTAEAKAKAQALEIEGSAIKANPDVIKMRAVENWDGALPKIVGGEPSLLLQGINMNSVGEPKSSLLPNVLPTEQQVK